MKSTFAVNKSLYKIMRNKIYYSKVDMWLMALIIYAPIQIALSIGGNAFAAVAIGVFAFALICITLFPCKYTLAKDSLDVRCGILLRYSKKYSEIEGARPSCNLLSAPALSLQRVRLDFNPKKKFWFIENINIGLVSPKDREGFIKDLNERISQAAVAEYNNKNLTPKF